MNRLNFGRHNTNTFSWELERIIDTEYMNVPSLPRSW